MVSAPEPHGRVGGEVGAVGLACPLQALFVLCWGHTAILPRVTLSSPARCGVFCV